MFILYIPLAVVGSHIFGIKGIFSAAAISNIITGILAFFMFRFIFNRMVKNLIL